MESGKSLGFDIENTFIAKDPEISAQAAEISYPSPPIFKRLDTPIHGLQNEELKLSAPNQMKNVAILSSKIEEARVFIPFLYSYRSVMKALLGNPIVKDAFSNGEGKVDNRIDIKKLTEMFKITFEPTVEQLGRLMESCKGIVSAISGIATDQNYVKSEVVFEKLADLFDILLNIDQLKLLKTGINRDLSFYRRGLSPDQMRENNNILMELPMWISTKNKIIDELSQSLVGKPISGTAPAQRSYKFFCDFLEYCVVAYRTRLLTPQKRNALLSAMVVTLLIHGSENQKENIYTAPRAHSVFKTLYANPVIPLYGENNFVPGFHIPSSRGFINDAKYPILDTAAKISQQSDLFILCKNMDHYRDLYKQSLPVATKMARTGEVEIENLYKLLASLSEMTLAISRQSIFKFVVQPNLDLKDAYEYDKAVKYNYTDEDFNAIVELIGYIKTLASTTILAEPAINQTCLTQINAEVQEYIQNTIERPLVRAKASGDAEAVEHISVLRDIFGQWRGASPRTLNYPDKTKQIKRHQIEKSVVAVSANQLDMLRVNLASIIENGSRFTKRYSAFKLSHFRPKHINQTIEFLDKARDWYYLLNYVPTIREASNLGFLWFRETYLDIDDERQFPVRSSLPFILSEHLLGNAAQPALHDSVFFPLEIYNDAAAQAINVYNSQYLYKEIEAEVSLCVDMIAFSFSETFYRCSRDSAAAIELHPSCYQKITLQPVRYSVMVQQNKMELLGANIDFNLITTKKLNKKMKDELESYIDMLTDIRLAPFVAHLIKVAHTTHSLLVESHLMMDDFNTIWQRASGFEYPLSLSSRLSMRVASIIDFPHFKLNCIDRRFLPTKELKLVTPTKENWGQVYEKIHQHEMVYIGPEHIRALIELLTPGELANVIQIIMDKTENNIIRFIESYTEVASVIRLLPATSKDDIVGFYGFNSDAYSGTSHPRLKKMFEAMRIIGNAVEFFFMLDTELPSSAKSSCLLTPLMKKIGFYLEKNKELFVQEQVDLSEPMHHRSFPSLWAVLEFLYCSPDPIRLDESNTQIVPIENFGDGPLLTAHIFITMCNQDSLYKFDSLCFHTLELYEAEQSSIPRRDIETFLINANIADQCRKVAEVIAMPFRSAGRH